VAGGYIGEEKPRTACVFTFSATNHEGKMLERKINGNVVINFKNKNMEIKKFFFL
jgi:hypothetical protein